MYVCVALQDPRQFMAELASAFSPRAQYLSLSLDRLALNILSFRVGDTWAFCCGIPCAVC